MLHVFKVSRWISLTVAAFILTTPITLYAAGTETAQPVNTNTVLPVSASERLVLDPGFGYQSIWEPLAKQLYAKSPVKAYLPTRLPDSDWNYYAITSSLLMDGYQIDVHKSTQLPSAGSTLPSSTTSPKSGPLLFSLSAGKASTQGTGTILLQQKGGWNFYADPAAAGKETDKQQLVQAFAGATKFSIPFTDAKGTVQVTGSGTDRVYSAYWTYDNKIGYTFESRTSLADFISLLYSFRPVINLLDSADVILLPLENEWLMGIGRTSAFHSKMNQTTTLSSAPAIIKGSVYLPLKNIVQFIQGNMQYVPAENAIHFSENGYVNPLKLNLKTGAVYSQSKKVATISVQNKGGTVLVPLSFLRDQFGLKLSYNSSTKKVLLQYSSWFANYRVQEQATKAEATLTVLSQGGPPFVYENSRLGSTGSWSYLGTKPPQGYNSLKYTLYEVTIPLLPGANAFVYRDHAKKTVIDSIPIPADLSPADIPFARSGYMLYDSLKMDLKLTSNDGKVWPSGYAEASSYVDLSGTILPGSPDFAALRLTYHKVNGVESAPVSFPVADNGSFAYRFKPDKGPGTYVVTVYNPPKSLPKGDLAGIVSFVVEIK